MFTNTEIKDMHTTWLNDLKKRSPKEIEVMRSAINRSGIQDLIAELDRLVKKAKNENK
jgi:hypothetical protein